MDQERGGAERRHIVVGADGSDCSLLAVDWAAEEAALRGCELVVLHVNFWADDVLALPKFEDQARIEEAILGDAEDRAHAAHADLTVVGRRVSPPAAEALVRESASAEMLVVGSRGLGGFEELLVGSVSRYCVLHARCPVVVVRDASSSHRGATSVREWGDPVATRTERPRRALDSHCD